jgi:biopolymer transport protein ExbD
MYGFLFGMAGSGAFYMISLHPNFNYLFVLIVIVMFTQVWNTLLLTFKKRAYQWMMISLVVVSLLSFGLSKINIVDYKTLNEIVINKRLDVKHHLRLPTSNTYETTTFRYPHLPIISLVTPKGGKDKDSGSILFVGNQKCDIAALLNKVKNIKARLPQELQLGMPVFLKVDKDIPMNYVHRVTKGLALADIQFLKYLVVPLEAEHDPRYYIAQERTHLSKFNQSHFQFDYEVNLERIETYSNKIKIQVSTGGYEINNLPVAQEDLAEILKSNIEDKPDYAIAMNFKEGLTFERYFVAISAIYQAIFSLRNKEALKEHGMDFRALEASFQRDAQRAIINKYPLRYIEIWQGSSNEFDYNIYPDRSLPKLKISEGTY